MDSERRDRVAEMALRAYTLDECRAAEQALQDWLRDHPQDWTMYEVARGLSTVKEAARQEESSRSEAARPVKPSRKAAA